MKILGIDSSTHTGLALLDSGGDDRVTELYVDAEGWTRIHLIAQNFERILNSWSPDVAFIENYGLNMRGKGKSNPKGIILQVEIGTILRMALISHSIPWRAIRPTTLKKWVTGRGDAKKPDMASVAASWGFSNHSDDIVDAYCLAKMGKWLLEKPMTEYPNGVEFGYGILANEYVD